MEGSPSEETGDPIIPLMPLLVKRIPVALTAVHNPSYAFCVLLVYVFRYVFSIVGLVAVGIPATLVALFDRSGESLVWFAKLYFRALLRVCGVRVVVEGLENVPRRAPVVFMSNHQSVFDVPALTTVLPVSWRFVAKRELTWIPVFGWALLLGGHVIIDRSRRERSVRSLGRAADRIRAGQNVIIYPEGTRSRTGELLPFKSGGFHLSIAAQVPIAPVTVSGSHGIVRKGSLRIESGTIKVTFGKPIRTHGISIEERERLKEQVREAISRGYDPELQGPLRNRLAARHVHARSSA
jgi:1-acyl-sn-glycerol-3-phosphate acyltransferase